MKAVLLPIALALISTFVSASVTKASGKINGIKFFTSGGQGVVAIYMNEVGQACGTGERRVLVTDDNKNYNSIISAALTAKATNEEVEIGHLGTCSMIPSAWDINHIYLK